LIARARQADLLVCTGADLEIGWLPLLLRQAANPAILEGQKAHFLAADYVLLKEAPSTIDRSQGDVHPEGNPHIQLDPKIYWQLPNHWPSALLNSMPRTVRFMSSAIASLLVTGKTPFKAGEKPLRL